MVECKGCHPKKLTGLTQTAVFRRGSALARLGRCILTDTAPRANLAVSWRKPWTPTLRAVLAPHGPAPVAGRASPRGVTRAVRFRGRSTRSPSAMAMRNSNFAGRNTCAPLCGFLFPRTALPVITSIDALGNKVAPKDPDVPDPFCHASRASTRHTKRCRARPADRIRGADNKWIFVKTHQRSTVI